MLPAALEQYRIQQRITALAIRQTRRMSGRSLTRIAQVIAAYQLVSINQALESAPIILAQQDIPATQTGVVATENLLTGTAALTGFLGQADTADAFDRIVSTFLLDATRTASVVDSATRPQVTGYVRSLNPPSCSRCAILAGRVYRYSTGFQRHPFCDCLMTPTDQANGLDLVTDPTEMFNRGEIRGLSKADTEAIKNGADMARVVNVRRQKAGLSIGGSVITRAGKLTPEGISRIANDKAEALKLLRANGYVR